MSDLSVNKYLVKEPFTLLQNLFLEGDRLYIQSYDPVAGRRQAVYAEDRRHIGYIPSTVYWDLRKSNIEQTK